MARHNGSQKSDADPARYRVEFTEPALAEADAAYLWLSEHSILDYAIRWYVPNLESPEQFKALIGLPNVHILPVAKNGVAYIGFEFGCTWDAEKGA